MENKLLTPSISTVVYVDDELPNTYLFSDQFEDKLNLTVFNCAKSALEFIEKTDTVLLVITDQLMPEVSGLELAEIARSKKIYLNFIMLTANPENDRQLMYKSLKNNLFFDFLQKPIDFNKKESLTDLFNKAINASFDKFLKFDYEKASRIFCRNPITLDERTKIKKIIARNFSPDIEIQFELSRFKLVSSNNSGLVSKLQIIIEKMVDGEWVLYRLDMGVKARCASSRKIENIFNLISHDESLSEIRTYLDHGKTS